MLGAPQFINLTLQRVMAGHPSMAEIAVTDACGDRPTSIGGGPSAF
jgi:hypothetical protein